MKWRSETIGDWKLRVSKWHKYFAWYPIFFYESRQTIWLDIIERRLQSYDFEYGATWEYRQTGEKIK